MHNRHSYINYGMGILNFKSTSLTSFKERNIKIQWGTKAQVLMTSCKHEDEARRPTIPRSASAVHWKTLLLKDVDPIHGGLSRVWEADIGVKAKFSLKGSHEALELEWEIYELLWKKKGEADGTVEKGESKQPSVDDDFLEQLIIEINATDIKIPKIYGMFSNFHADEWVILMSNEGTPLTSLETLERVQKYVSPLFFPGMTSLITIQREYMAKPRSNT